MTEHDLQAEIMKELSKHGDVFRINVVGAYTKDGRYIPPSVPKGFSDLLYIKDGGRAGFVEVKVKPNRLTPEQRRFIAHMRERGAMAGAAYSIEDALGICEIQGGVWR
jgi:hypothetical protein